MIQHPAPKVHPSIVSSLREAAPGRRPPRAGEQWRVNFSRVEWQADVKSDAYVKRVDEITAPGFNGMVVHSRQDGKVWLTK